LVTGDDPWGEGLTFVILDQKIMTSPPYVFHVETGSLPDEAYKLYVRAISLNSGNNTGLLTHLIDNTGPSLPTSVDDQPIEIARTFQLQQNYPNPFNPSTVIKYAMSNRQYASLKVYNVLGNEVATLVNEVKEAGVYEIEFKAEGLPSGIYFYRLQAGNFAETKKLILLK